MPRKKQAKQEEMLLSIPEPAAPATPEGQAVLEALRSNLALLGELAARYEVAFQPERPAEMPTINCPQDVHNLLGPEMSALAQEQLRVLLLNTRNQVRGQRVVYMGNVNSSVIRPAEVLRAAVIESAPSIIISATTTRQRRPNPQPRGRVHHPRVGTGGQAPRHRPPGPRGHRRRPLGQPQGTEADGRLAPMTA